MTWKPYDREPGERRLPYGVLMALLVGLAVVVIVVGGLALRWWSIPFFGALEAREQTEGDGSYRIASYDQFFDRCASIQALEDQIATMEGNSSIPKDQRETNVLALTNQRNTLIRQYNADAAKEDTRGNFRASDLPYEIDPDQETTTCRIAD